MCRKTDYPGTVTIYLTAYLVNPSGYDSFQCQAFLPSQSKKFFFFFLFFISFFFISKNVERNFEYMINGNVPLI